MAVSSDEGRLVTVQRGTYV